MDGTTERPMEETPDFDAMTNAELLDFIHRKGQESDGGDDDSGDDPGFYTPEMLDKLPVIRDLFIMLLKQEHGIPTEDDGGGKE